MTSYYQLLSIPTSAGGPEIQAAIDNAYNLRRQMVTHPDPKTRARAEEELRSLEEARAILLDPVRRAAYDVTLELSDMGGLADPAAKAQPQALPHHAPARTSSQPAQDVNPWQCPRCETINLPESLHCERCGTQLADPCPKCDRITPLSARYCNRCGSDLVAARAERDRQLVQQHEAQLRDQIISLQGQIAGVQGQIELNARLAKWWIPRPWPIIEDEVILAHAGGYLYLRELGAGFLLWVILTIVWSAAGGGNLRSLVLLLVLSVGAATVIVMLARFRKAKRKGANKLNGEHQKRIDELDRQIRQLQGS